MNRNNGKVLTLPFESSEGVVLELGRESGLQEKSIGARAMSGESVRESLEERSVRGEEREGTVCSSVLGEDVVRLFGESAKFVNNSNDRTKGRNLLIERSSRIRLRGGEEEGVRRTSCDGKRRLSDRVDGERHGGTYHDVKNMSTEGRESGRGLTRSSGLSSIVIEIQQRPTRRLFKLSEGVREQNDVGLLDLSATVESVELDSDSGSIVDLDEHILGDGAPVGRRSDVHASGEVDGGSENDGEGSVRCEIGQQLQ